MPIVFPELLAEFAHARITELEAEIAGLRALYESTMNADPAN
jgi:hypothetical protein